jgi:hypothetical protein
MIKLTVKFQNGRTREAVESGSEYHTKISASELKALREFDAVAWKGDMLKIVEPAFHRQQKKKQA